MSVTIQPARLSDEDLLLALGNTGHVEVDELTDAEGVLAWWTDLVDGGASVPPDGAAAVGPHGPALLRDLRDAVRDLATGNTGGNPVPDGGGRVDVGPLVGALALQPSWSGGRLTLRAAPGADLADHVAAAVVAALLRSQARPAWPRLKACWAPDCRWLFVDASRNRSRRWCDMAECGNRAKSAAFRRRRRS